MKRTALLLLVLALLCMTGLASAASGNTNYNNNVILSPASPSIFEGETLQLELYTQGPALDGDVTWKSNAMRIASVDQNGLVTGLSKGTATITATVTKDKRTYTATARVTVNRAVTGITVTTKDWNLFEPDDQSLQGLVPEDNTLPVLVLLPGRQLTNVSASLTPKDASGLKFTVASSDPDVARVQGTTVKAVAPGTCVLTVASVLNPAVCCEYLVLVINPVTSITVTGDATMFVGDAAQLTAQCLPADAGIQAVTWTSSAPRVVAVDQYGMVTALTKGQATITATATDGSNVKGTFKLTVSTVPTAISICQNQKEISTLNVKVGTKVTLTATVKPADVTNKSVIWTSSDPSVADVTTAGVVTGVRTGTCVLTAASSILGDLQASVVVNVVTPVTGITITGENTMFTGDVGYLSAECYPANADIQEVAWSSSNPRVVAVDQNGMVTALTKGQATVTAAATDGSGVTSSFKITVSTVPTAIAICQNQKEISTLNMKVGARVTLTATVKPADVTNKTVIWTSSDPSVADVSTAGVVTGVRTGTCVLTAASSIMGDLQASVVVNVITPVTGITVTGESTMFTGDVGYLSAECYPANADIQEVTWTSSAPKIAVVDQNGMVTALSNGITTITAAATDGSGVKGSFRLTVSVPPTALNIRQNGKEVTSINLNVSAKTTLTAVVLPATVSDKTVTWSTSDPSVATVSANGQVAGISVGDAVITAESNIMGDVRASVFVHVVQPVTRLQSADKSLSVLAGQSIATSWTVTPANATIQTLTYKSSNNKVATVDSNGYVYGVAGGKVTITATTTDGSRKSATVQVTVIQPVTGVHMKNNRTGYNVGVGESLTVTAELEPTNATNKNMTWTIEDPTLASIKGTSNRPTMSGKRWGDTTVYGVTEDGGYPVWFSLHVGNYDKALKTTALYLQSNAPKISVINESNMTMTWFTFEIEMYDLVDNPIICSADGSNVLHGSYKLTLAEGTATQHGRFSFGDYLFPDAIIGRMVMTITAYQTDTGFRHNIAAANRVPFEFIADGFVGPVVDDPIEFFDEDPAPEV